MSYLRVFQTEPTFSIYSHLHLAYLIVDGEFMPHNIGPSTVLHSFLSTLFAFVFHKYEALTTPFLYQIHSK